MSRTDRDGGSREQAREIAAMFDKVAPRYDFLNRVLSLRMDARWRRRAVRLARLDADQLALDLGVGTGDLAFELLASSPASSRVVGIDVSEGMLDRVRARAAASPLGSRFEARSADAQALPFEARSFDRVVAGFSVRNFGDVAAGFREMQRVLRPEGRVVILEFSTPPNPLVRTASDLYIHGLVPRIAAALGGEPGAYRYLPRSVARFPGAERLADLLRAAGFSRVRFERLTFGVVAIHVAEL
jgi:demethylmenaquinone methyltransferase/2-methoxy-6-polyprenyl-1,4-benzoquinol methylase